MKTGYLIGRYSVFFWKKRLLCLFGESFVCDFSVKLTDEGIGINRTDLSAVTAFEREGAGLHLLVTDDDEVGDFLKFGASDTFSEGFTRSIGRHAYRGVSECVRKGFCIGLVSFADRKDADLFRREPEREITGDILDKHAEESFYGSHDGGMDHDDALVFALFIDAEKIEPFRHAHIELDGRNLPLTPESVPGHEVELRSIESRFPDTVEGVSILLFRDIFENGFGKLPLFLRTEIGVRN